MTRRTGWPAILAHAELLPTFSAEQIMPMPALRPRRWTLAEVERLIDARDGFTPRYELVDGELLVTPAPSGRHQRIILRLVLLLQPYLSRERLGEIRLGPGKLELRATPENYFEPDLFVVPAADGRLPSADDPSLPPLLVCETLSPSSSRHDRITKRRAFQRQSVPEYWVIDGTARIFEIWHPGEERPVLAEDRVVWFPVGASAAFELDVQAFFASIADGAPLS